MNDFEIDNQYITANFINILNSISKNASDKALFLEIFELIILNLINETEEKKGEERKDEKAKFNLSLLKEKDKVSYILNIIDNLLKGNDSYNSLLLLRQINYLIYKAVYLRVNKKFKNDLINFNATGNNSSNITLETEFVDKISEIIKKYLESLNFVNFKNLENFYLQNNFKLKDFQILTEMPVNSNKNEFRSSSGNLNVDSKKQNIKIKLNLQGNNKISDNNTNNKINSITTVSMDKTKLISFYEEIEKIQEKLDKLY